MKKLVIAALFLPRELLRPRPVAAQADLDVAARVDVPLLDEPVHRRPVRDLHAEDLRARVGVGVEVDEAEPAVPGGAGADVRLGDRVVAAEDDRNRTRSDDLSDRPLDRLVRPSGVGGDNRRVAVVDQPQLGHRVDLCLEVRPRRAAGGANRARAKACARPVGDEVVRRRADDRDVDALELGRVLRVGKGAEREQARVVGLLSVPAPALERVNHAVIL